MTRETPLDPCGILQPNSRPGGAVVGGDLSIGREVASLELGRLHRCGNRPAREGRRPRAEWVRRLNGVVPAPYTIAGTMASMSDGPGSAKARSSCLQRSSAVAARVAGTPKPRARATKSRS